MTIKGAMLQLSALDWMLFREPRPIDIVIVNDALSAVSYNFFNDLNGLWCRPYRYYHPAHHQKIARLHLWRRG
ncbi:hypothetical protein [Candidatus Phyllobacterium onerii]|uniref:hypothetical protein n=1 Tax=Candidatus Phyllobacterium onerii TaxID=3020828 RepID=UPI002330E78A|nr:hypothetical protein [Phyllobacterium sp. IY22]